MARGGGIRRRSRRMRRGGKIGAGGGAVVETHAGGQVKVGRHGIRGCNGGGSLGQVVNAGNADFELDKASSAGSATEDWIYVRGHRIEKAGLHIDAHGNVYVPDSEDEDSGMEYQADHKDVPVQKPLVLAADEDLRMKVPDEVPEQLKEVLANMDPIYHDVFVSMYKILVPICFRSSHH